MRHVYTLALTGLAISSVSGCATKGFVRRGLAEQQSAMVEERGVRAAGDSLLGTGLTGVRGDVGLVRGDVASVRSDLAALRTELTTLRTEFGAKISAVEGQITFAMPVHFGFDAAAVREQDQAALTKFARVAAAHYRGATISVEGFADPAGSTRYNRQLSKRRADAVRQFLVANGLDGANLRSIGYGEARQVRAGAAKDAPGAELNRRVTFVVETSSESTMAAIVMR